MTTDIKLLLDEDVWTGLAAALRIIVAQQSEKGVLLRRTIALLETLTPEKLAHTFRFV